jgi:class 3 adenylate cyclase
VGVGARFCATCGNRLDAPAAKEEERKLVTVLFADLTGSTALGERLDPERLRALLAEYFAAMASVIESWGGVVEKFIGDAVMAVFGIPAAREDDSERALRAALEMQSRLEDLNDEIAERHGVRLAVRIGVNSGEVIAGIGGDQFMVTGDVVNVAARLQQTAEAGEVVAGERTFLATRGLFRTEQLEDRALKGKELPVRAWRVLETDERALRESVPAASSRLVGRTRELSLLDTLYRGCIEDARPQLVTILGHAGVGKSRLTEEFVGHVRAGAGGPPVFRGRCLAYGEGITFWALREIIWHAAGIALDDSAGVAADKLGTLVRTLFADSDTGSEEADSVLFALATSAGIAVPENPLDEMTPESIGAELGLAWPRFLTALASRGPTIVAIDDLHRGDPPMLDMVERLVARSDGPVFLVATGRPELAELRAGWSARPGKSQISLEPLPDSQAEELVDNLAPRLGTNLRQRIVATAEGNPLFAEEIVEHLVDRGVLARSGAEIVEVAPDAEVTIPDTVRAVLAARVDALPPDEKRVLQHAAVVGKVFWATSLESMLDAPVGPALRTLEDRGFVVTRRSSSFGDQTELAFRHGLIREVAYESIPRARRALAHAEVGRWLEEVAADRRDEYVDLIAHHLESAARPEDAELAWPSDAERRDEIRSSAVEALVEAGRAEAAKSAIDQALGFGDRALALARSDTELLAAYELKAYAAQAAVRADEAWSYYVAALAAAGRLDDRAEVQRLRALATLFWARWRGMLTGEAWIQQAGEILQQGLAEAGDDAASFEVGAFLTGRSSAHFWDLGKTLPDEARRDAERAVEIAQEIGSETLLSYSLDMLYAELMFAGFCESDDFARRALEVGRTMEDRSEAHELLVTAAIAFAHAGRFDEAAATGAQTVALAARLGPHRSLHAGSALTNALLPPGRLAELREATATAPSLVAEEGMHTCYHGLAALAGQALCAFEDGDDAAARRALDVYDTAELSGVLPKPAETIEILRPLIGADAARRRIAAVEPDDAERHNVQARVRRLRLELQLSALARDWVTLRELVGRARPLARSACAPYLEWIADWAHAFELAERGETHEAGETARTAASALDAYGESYLAARLLVDLLPVLEPREAERIAEGVIPRLEAMGGRSSAAEAAASL